MMDRREFLVYGSALPLLRFAQEDQARARMKATGRWGVVIAAPEDPKQRVRLGMSLYNMAEFEEEYGVAHEILAQIVLIATTRKSAFNRTLLSPAGEKLAEDVVPLDVYDKPEAFAASFKAFVHGAERERLKARAREMEAGFDAALKKAVADLRTPEGRIAGAVELTRRVESLTPYLGWLAEDGVAEARMILRRYFATLPAETPGARLPFGCVLGKFLDSCGYYVPADQKEMIACGMARVVRRAGKFISFLGK